MDQKTVKKQLGSINPGDLVSLDWCDASVGKSNSSGAGIDVHVKSWGIYIGVLGTKVKHIVLAQNSFRYADGLFDLDYTAIPLNWTITLTLLVKEHIEREVAGKLVNSFLMGGNHALSHRSKSFQRRVFQQRLSVDGRPD
jgi:hypothetical protein